MIFTFPGETTIIEVIDEILKNNGLTESPGEFFNKSTKGQEPRAIVVRDAAISLTRKKAPEDVIASLLQKHLATSKEVAQKIISDIKEKILPFAGRKEAPEKSSTKIDLPEEEKKEAFKKAKEELLRKIEINKNIPKPEPKQAPTPYKKNPEITDVEDNAKDMEKEKKLTISNNPEPLKPAPTPQKNSDPYKEAIE